MYRPHCARCDDLGCDGMADRECEARFIEASGEKPAKGLMRSAWEHAFMVWCRAWQTCMGWKQK